MSGTYSVIVAENGNAAVVLFLDGEGAVEIPLPLDAETYAVDGALYMPSENGVEVSIASAGSASVIFETALLTSKSGDNWAFEMEVAEFESGSVTVFLPENTTVSSTEPKATVSASDDSKTLLWQVSAGTGTVGANYVFAAEPGPGPAPPQPPKDEETTDYMLVAVLVVLFAAVLIAVFYFKKKP